ncbi:MAG: DUF362 domain-containing protein [Candidatus Omnitrophica bacterium]|nr:DUF362 domain-containing protein [Candidatus Omnitrophota bacterium]
MKSEVAIVKCKEYSTEEVERSLRSAIELLGGIRRFIAPQSRVLVKPNLLVAIEPERALTTHPQVVRAAIRILKDIGCKVFVGDGPITFGAQCASIETVYARTGIKAVCHAEGAELVEFTNRRWHGKFPMTTWLDTVDYLVNIPKFKTHELTVLTGAIKNTYGLVSGTFKTELHKLYFKEEEFVKVIVDVFQEARPCLSIVDGIVALEGDGPGTGGKPRKAGLLLASADSVALDAVLARVMGIKPGDVLTTPIAAQRGLGVADIGALLIHGERLEDICGEKFLLPVASVRSKIPKPLVQFIKRFVKYYPVVCASSCIRCQACVSACPQRIIEFQSERIHINYKKCISCFCCQEVCPAAAISIKKTFLAKLLRF